jgi:hypothetical protein
MRQRAIHAGVSTPPDLLLSLGGRGSSAAIASIGSALEDGSSTSADIRRPALRRSVLHDLDITDPKAMNVHVPCASP